MHDNLTNLPYCKQILAVHLLKDNNFFYQSQLIKFAFSVLVGTLQV